jgi:hypothetical protein
VNAPVACLFRVKLERLLSGSDGQNDATAHAVRPDAYSCELRVVARDAEAAVASARACMRNRLDEANHTRVVSVEIVDGIDVLSPASPT